MCAPAIRMVPSTVAFWSSLSRARIWALVRSRAVWPGALSRQFSPINMLLMSLIDRSIVPVASQGPSSIISAPTNSRGALIALSAAVGLA